MLRRLLGRVAKKVRGTAERAAQRPPPAPAPAPEPIAPAETLATISAGAQEVRERVEAGEPVTLLDVRQPQETAGGIIKGAILIPLSDLEARWEEVKHCDEIVCYCAAGMRSLRAAELLRARGVFNATSMEGGVSAWTAEGGELVAPPA